MTDDRYQRAPQVEVTQGLLRGTWRDNTAQFLGIPFAQAPVGPLRFGAPEQPTPWTGVRNATAYGPTANRTAAPQPFLPEMLVPGDETLNLNVFTPDPTARGTDRMPVLVWIHGGGFITGTPKNEWYEGGSFAADGIVVVTVGYRLGFDGFGLIEGAPANRAILDWLAALTWVRDNIKAFGGDPAQVTIAGQSAGGGAVLTLLALEEAQPLFRAAISLSAGVADTPRHRAAALTRRMAARAHVTPDRAGFASVPEERLLKLQQEQVIGTPTRPHRLAATGASLVTGTLPIGPVVDGDLITRPTLDSLAAGIGADKPLLIVTTLDENQREAATEWFPRALDLLPRALALRLVGLPAHMRRPFLRQHPALSTRWLLGRLAADTLFHRLALEVVEARAQAPSWLARFDWRSPITGDAPHCIEMPFFFDILDAPSARHLLGDAPPQTVADELHGAALSILRGNQLHWEPWTPAQGAMRVLDTTCSTEPDAHHLIRQLSQRL
ncbi:carboxylesterase/lipase family protein [Streptomyces chartreusis]|uniref:carboxylesterase/lipase family protein n=1 Tax=Streptomyces chartreusis TaxID=1969 RepID=UPI00367E530F